MTATIATLIVCLTSSSSSSPEPATILHYPPGLFERVARVRVRQGYHLPKTEGFAAVPDCSRIGQVIWVQVGQKRARVTVADCARPRDYKRLKARNTVELDYRTAVRLGVVKHGRVRGWCWSE